MNANVRPGNWLVVVGAGGGLGHLAGMCFPFLCGLGDELQSTDIVQFNMQELKGLW